MLVDEHIIYNSVSNATQKISASTALTPLLRFSWRKHLRRKAIRLCLRCLRQQRSRVRFSHGEPASTESFKEYLRLFRVKRRDRRDRVEGRIMCAPERTTSGL
jgi:hypothetical protein